MSKKIATSFIHVSESSYLQYRKKEAIWVKQDEIPTHKPVCPIRLDWPHIVTGVWQFVDKSQSNHMDPALKEVKGQT